MSTTTTTLPYSVSTGSAFSAFDKLQGIKNYAHWKMNMHTVLLALWQWGMVDGMIKRPDPVDKDNLMPDEVTAMEVWDLRAISGFMEISFRVADSAKNVLGSSQSPKDAWEALERHFGAWKEGIQSSLIPNLEATDVCGEWKRLDLHPPRLHGRFTLAAGGVQRSQLPDPRSAREAMAAPDAQAGGTLWTERI